MPNSVYVKYSMTKDKMAPLKAILSLLIVADHLSFWISSSWIQPFRELGAPIVSVFLFISGYGLMKSYTEKGDEYLNSFGRRRLFKVIIPSLVALILYWLICFDPERNYLQCCKSLIFNGAPLLPYSWYVATIVALYSCFWLSFKYMPKRLKCFGVIFLSFVYILLVILLGYDWCWWIGTLSFPTGLIYAKYEERASSFIFKNWLNYSVALIACLICTAALVHIHSPYSYMVSYIFIPIFVALVVSILPIERFTCPAITFFSGISYEIYLCQGIAMEFLRPYISSNALYMIAVYAMVTVLAFCVNRICRLLFPRMRF